MPGPTPDNVADAINEIAADVNAVLESKATARYFESLVLLYSTLENVLKFLVCLKLLWERIDVDADADHGLPADAVEAITEYSRRLSFYPAIEVAFSLGVISAPLRRRLHEVRKERNDVVHQAWLFEKRRDGRVMRKKLEKVARISGELVESANELVSEIGVDEAWEVWP